MHKYVILILCLLSLAHAEPSAAPSERSIRELLKATKAKALVDGIMVQMDQIMRQARAQATQGRETSPEVNTIAGRMQDKMTALMKEELDWTVLEPLYISVYQETFTQEEIDGMLAFYQTSVGQTVVKKLPVVVQKTMSSMQARMGPMMQKLQAIQEETMREVHAAADAKKS